MHITHHVALNVVGDDIVFTCCSFHDTLKRLLPSSRISVDVLVCHLLSMTTVRAVETLHRTFDATMKTTVVNGASADIGRYYALCSNYCAHLIRAESDKASLKAYGVQEVFHAFLICCTALLISLVLGVTVDVAEEMNHRHSSVLQLLIADELCI